ncbi:DUF3892 domain-containing protein [Pseudomonas sp. BC42]|uniref:DUF3892 domain-containing protein n=1 Tax=Pseudomonas sp. BC42 TaxID=2933816 RepID=UPI001F31F941|nr:DUF3892 domain-containing protein [Pseudomonas sp. BC42]ULT73052.1 DUF3892 domain-containing protein [Pseudomonas sp. BC42]
MSLITLRKAIRHQSRIREMTDFCITRVQYDGARQRITYVEVSENLPQKFGTKRAIPRGFVADLIRLNKATFSTWVMNADGTYKKGADVHVLDDVYLSTDRNGSKRDNLGSLPEF